MEKALISYLIFFVLNASFLSIIEPSLDNSAQANLSDSSQILITTDTEFFDSEASQESAEKDLLICSLNQN